MRHFFLFLAWCSMSMLSALEVSLWIDNIDIRKQTDAMGDQVYCFILEKAPNGEFTQFTHPSFPFSFTKDGINHMKPFSVWHDVFVDGDHYEVIFSLFDREVMPWLPDELLGHLKIGMDWNDKNFDVQWVGLSAGTTVEETNDPLVRKIIMQENGADYTVNLRLHLNKP